MRVFRWRGFVFVFGSNTGHRSTLPTLLLLIAGETIKIARTVAYQGDEFALSNGRTITCSVCSMLSCTAHLDFTPFRHPNHRLRRDVAQGAANKYHDYV